jgi:protein SCO1
MKRHRMGSWIPLGALALLTVAACGTSEAAGEHGTTEEVVAHEHGAPAAHDHGAAMDEMPADEPADFSIYHSESVWTDQHGEPRPLASLAGRIQVVGMVYTSCGYACPRMILDMRRLGDELGDRDDVSFVLASIDPERDTPERLAEYAEGARLDPAQWTLLHGDEGDVLELAALLGVRYRKMANGEFIHSNLLTVLDRGGQIVHRQMGLGVDPAATLEAIRSLDR